MHRVDNVIGRDEIIFQNYADNARIFHNIAAHKLI